MCQTHLANNLPENFKKILYVCMNSNNTQIMNFKPYLKLQGLWKTVSKHLNFALDIKKKKTQGKQWKYYFSLVFYITSQLLPTMQHLPWDYAVVNEADI